MSPSILDDEGSAPSPAGRKTGAIDGVATSGATAPPRASNVRRAKPASASTPPPPTVPLDEMKAYDPIDLDRLISCLASFTAPDESALPKTEEAISPHQMPEVEQLFSLIARVGSPLLPWETIRPVFLWKIRHVMEEMVRVERLIDARVKRTREAETGPPPPAPPHQVRGGVPYRPPAEGWEDEGSDLRDSYRFVLGKAASFTAAPFTFQRLCELLADPLRHYKKADKFFRALEKCINVVTCVTESGIRITGIEEEEEQMDTAETSPTGRIENRFFGRVDECDDKMDTSEPFTPISMMPRPPSAEGVVKSEEKEHGSGDSPAVNIVNGETDRAQPKKEEAS